MRKKRAKDHSEPGALELQLCFALYSASLAITKLYKPLLDPLGLTYPQFLVMLVLWQGDNVSVSDLGGRLTLDSGTLTPLLKRLQSAGLVLRSRDPRDERRVLVRLTVSGQLLKAHARSVQQQVVAGTACDDSTLTTLTLRLRQLRDDITQTFSDVSGFSKRSQPKVP